MLIREATPADDPEIRAVVLDCFPGPAEADLVERLRDDGDVVFSLVAIEGDLIVGHVLLSRMRCPSRTLGLAPVAVLSQYRKQGVAAALIGEGLRRAAANGWRAVFVLGDDYYRRFGFDPRLAEAFNSRYAGPHLMGLVFGDPIERSGELEYASAFDQLA
jgi:putative acetyltransferase